MLKAKEVLIITLFLIIAAIVLIANMLAFSWGAIPVEHKEFFVVAGWFLAPLVVALSCACILIFRYSEHENDLLDDSKEFNERMSSQFDNDVPADNTEWMEKNDFLRLRDGGR